MPTFTPDELTFLAAQRLGRLATVDSRGRPHVVPVSFHHNPELNTIDIGGHDIARSKKFRDITAHPEVAFVVDEVLPPWHPRGVEVRGHAEALSDGGSDLGPGFDQELIRIHPRRIIGWGIDTDAFAPHARSGDAR